HVLAFLLNPSAHHVLSPVPSNRFHVRRREYAWLAESRRIEVSAPLASLRNAGKHSSALLYQSGKSHLRSLAPTALVDRRRRAENQRQARRRVRDECGISGEANLGSEHLAIGVPGSPAGPP